eukprot:14281365-Alexandrium_andersonii.AAC.1
MRMLVLAFLDHRHQRALHKLADLLPTADPAVLQRRGGEGSDRVVVHRERHVGHSGDRDGKETTQAPLPVR